MGNNNPYPVFRGGVAAEMANKQRRSGGGGGDHGLLWALLVIVGACVLLVVAAPVFKGCKEDREHAAGEARQREEARCAKDLWAADCAPEVRARLVCEQGASKRRTWIDTGTPEMEGYAPSTFHMSAEGKCGDTLRVRESDCSVAYLGEAYGNKPFMRTAQSLGFRRFSCGYDEFEFSTIMRAGR